jgi:transposase
VGDQRHQNPGQPPLAPPDVREKLAAALDGSAPDGGLWTSKKVAAWLAKELGVEHIHTARRWELMHQLGYRSYVLRPRHRKADPAEQDAWKKNCPT